MSLTKHLQERIDRDTAKTILYNMISIRSIEQSCAQLYAEEKIRGFLHLYIGEEAIASTIIPLLKKDDQIFATYREHAHAFVRGISLNQIIAEMFGKITGCCKGRGGSMHLFDVSNAFYGGNAIVAGHLPLAVGCSLANKKFNNNLISVCFFGEGAIAEGVFHESINIAQLWKLPILLICENNYYAMGISIERSQSQINLIKKIESYNIKCSRVNGMSVSHIYEEAQKAIEYVRKEQRPFFLECNTYRLCAHSMFDAQLYRSKEEIDRWKKNDPIEIFKKILIELDWITSSDLTNFQNDIENLIQTSIDFALDSQEETMQELTKGYL